MNALVDLVFNNSRVHHVGIVAPNERQALGQMARLGLREDYRGRVWDVTCIFTLGNGGSPVEFVVPGPASALATFNKGVGGIHHIALTVEDLEDATRRLNDMGVRLVAKAPVKGAGPFLCNFLPPIYTRGFAVELVQVLPTP
jgi:methylmalonyl-CoA/ethylmalonyl-CoA epimerase